MRVRLTPSDLLPSARSMQRILLKTTKSAHRSQTKETGKSERTRSVGCVKPAAALTRSCTRPISLPLMMASAKSSRPTSKQCASPLRTPDASALVTTANRRMNKL